MAGHSKWANIKHKKARVDAKKGKVFSRIAKEIIVAVKEGGNDPKGNTRLRLALQKARAANMPSDNIDRNIKKASSADQSDYVEVVYEIYGHGGVGIVVEGMTDNKNRMASEMRISTNKRGGTIASSGAVVFNFDRKGVIQMPKDQEGDEDTVFMAVTDAGAEDFEALDDMYVVTTDAAELYAVKDAIEEQGMTCSEASLEMIPKTTVDCDEDTAKSNEALIEWIEDIEDVDAVFHNMSV
ncbi:MAG: YebC/PmpR family DNA-binding transcriptional regulator [Waddliaceae bacterium]|nr:YebC/PmpR family DNA-binding transcriptional regulator [Waddliaceae bacterium]MBT7264644.1 YebC/PmpR family DNA-binding transcriptional regulator [Waddliaceae bacterium]MBT7461538.1 YebC/PmpR family DNA-binding transcriptional regulator [Waddliaceae bacterium]